MRKLLSGLTTAALLTGCLTETPLDPISTATLLAIEGGTLDRFEEPVDYTALGDCSEPVVVDPGTVQVTGNVLTERAFVFDCPLTGDIEGTIRVIRSGVLKGIDTGAPDGDFWGITIVSVNRFLGEAGLTGTFEGPFRLALAAGVVTDFHLARLGTGDFEGLLMKASVDFEPPGLNLESGRIFATK